MGYVVSGKHAGRVYQLSDYGDESTQHGILCYSKDATIFPDRRAAVSAVQRTRAYSTRHNMNWDDDYVIHALRGIVKVSDE